MRMARLACIIPVVLLFVPARLIAQVGALLSVHFLNVGQGDATLIQLGHKAVLIDAGRGDDIVLLLQDLGVDTLVAAIASHNHDDHIGGMDAVLADWPVGRYLYNGLDAPNRNAEAVLEWLDERGIDAPDPPWEPIVLGDAVIRVLPSPLAAQGDENNASLVVLVERGRFRALLTGDSEVEELTALLAARLVGDVDVLKAAHHGARNGVTPGWLQRTRPEVVVVSVGPNNYGHPDPWAMRYYQAGGRRVLRTDREGTVTVTVEAGGRYEVSTEVVGGGEGR
ncbi:MAG: MBL fold metallo-hydrolase [Gemmatimonadetes bacterium]|nr:MBL fold metallo-hydrolase [Gemmatimonadota bacterium]